MYKYINNVTLGQTFLPDSRKHVDPLVGGAIIGGISALASGAMSYASNQKSNAANQYLASEENRIALQQYQAEAIRQNQWNERQYQEYWKQRQYDDIAKQVARYKAAGINPYFALGQIQGGQAAGSTPQPSGSVPTPSLTTPTMQPFDFTPIGTQLSDVMNNYFVNRQISAQTENQLIKNFYEVSRQIKELDALEHQNDVSIEQKHKIRAERLTLEQMREHLVNNAKSQGVVLDKQAKLLDQQIIGQDLQNSLNQLEFDWKQKFNEQELKNLKRTYDEIVSRVKVNDYNAVYIAISALKTAAEKEHIQLDNYILEKTKNFLIKSSENASELSGAGLGLTEGKYNPVGLVANLLSSIFSVGIRM